jgi:hypothetical protein
MKLIALYLTFSLLTINAQVSKVDSTARSYTNNIIDLANSVQKKWGSKKSTVIIVDFSKPMEVERLYVVDLDSQKIVKSSKVCHGIGSGQTSVPSKFSNTPNSKTSSKGVMRTAESYQGNWGYAMRVDGLQDINSNVRSRAIVFHNAEVQHTPYSWGCFSMPKEDYKKVIDLTKDGSLIFVFSNNNDIKSF